MKFPSGVIASCGCSYGQTGPGFLNINGETGFLAMEPGFNYGGAVMRGMANRKPVQQSGLGPMTSQFTLEAQHFTNCIRNNQEPLSDGEEGLKDMIAIEAIYKAAGTPIA